ncbi:MAG: hypothetical protein RIF36_09495 [Imperialibacter sp.]|uniref:hypothetical protein n=1 Tax=Imperialibacter sp. TaxID=2038411 RepID=UPI0032EAE5B2
MEDIYVSKLKEKSSQQLKQLIRNKDKYRAEAVNAAIRILNERDGGVRPLLSQQEVVRRRERISDFDWLYLCFNLRLYMRSFKVNDLINPLVAALFLLSLTEIVEWYANEDFMSDNSGKLQSIFVLVAVLFSHLLYRLDHGFSNNFIGRVFSDTILSFFFTILEDLHGLLTGETSGVFPKGAASFFGVVFAMAWLAFFFETCVGLVKSISRSFKWHIL